MTYARNFKNTNQTKEDMLYLIVDYPAVKIGYTNNLCKRMKDYRTYNPYAKLITVKHGDKKLEMYYHARMQAKLKPLDPTSIQYEWYKVPSDSKEYKKLLDLGFNYFD